MHLLLRIWSAIMIVTNEIAGDCTTKKFTNARPYFQTTCINNSTWSDLHLHIKQATQEAEDFTPLKLKAIFLRNNNLKTISKDFFKQVPELEFLELGNNKIQSFDPETFKSLKKLSLLNLWTNEIKDLDKNSFDGLISLQTLDLHNNKLTTLPAGIFDKLEKLHVINLSGNRFESLPGTLFQKNQQLHTVRLRFERTLTSLPSGLFSNLKNLKVVQLDGSKLESLPEDLFRGSLEVKDILLPGNALKNLPGNVFQGLKKLQKLLLNDNMIEYLPDDIFSQNENLEELNLNHNQIKNISGALLRGLRSLKKLKMQNNSISSIETTAFVFLQKVEEIYLSHNKISDIVVLDDKYMTLSVFYSCGNLRKLDLSFNKINRIFSDWTSQPLGYYFNHLDLSNNDISSLFDFHMDFKHLQDFHINLSDNKISRIDINNNFEERFLQEKRSKIEVIMKDNPLKCDCFLYDFVRYLDGSRPELKSKLQIDVGSIQCSSPEELKGSLLSNLKSEDYRCVASDFENYEGICPASCSRWIKPSDNKLIFDCAYKNLTEAPKTMCKLTNTQYSNEVNLTGNFIKNIPNMNQIGYDRVRNLVLSNNNISTITKGVFSPALLTLELDNNTITTLSSDMLSHLKNTNLQNIKLGGNPWKCDCNARDFQHYIQSSGTEGKFRIPDVEKISCQNSRKVLKTMTVNELCPAKTETIILISLTIAALGLMIGILTAVYYRYQRKIKVWLYTNQKCLWLVTERELDKNKPYDAFISYSHKDEEFVLKELVPKLEEGPKPFKLCIHFRDWLAGEWIPAQIIKSVRDSKRTIVVVSPNFVQSEWGRLEFRAAHSQALNEGRGRVVVILYGDIGPTDKLEPELKAYLSMNTYAKWGDPWFWDKLRYFLPHNSDLVERSPGSRIFRNEHAPTIGSKTKDLENGTTFVDVNEDDSKKSISAY